MTTTRLSCYFEGQPVENYAVVPSSSPCDTLICVDGHIVSVFNCSDFGAFSNCSSACDSHEYAYRTRSCHYYNPNVALVAHSLSLLCSEEDMISCYSGPCKKDCSLGPWSPWSECSGNCNKSIETSRRSRSILSPASNGGKECDALVEERTCDHSQCNVTCDEPNMEYSNCSNQCPFACEHISALMDGHAAVECVASPICQKGCKCRAPYLLQDGKCVPPSECRCHFEFTDLPSPGLSTQVSTLLSTIGTGNPQTTTLENHGSTEGDNLLPNSWFQHNCMNCSCDEKGASCSPIPGCTIMSTTSGAEWCSWSPWSPCLYSSGQESFIQTRQKICSPSNRVVDEDTHTCTPSECHVNKANLLTAMNKSADSPLQLWIVSADGNIITVEDGQVVQEKVLINYQCGTILCLNGSFVLNSSSTCKYDCQWSDWSDFGTCNASCGQGYHTRTRTIIRPASPNGLGKPCTEAAEETVPCNTLIECPCDVTEWSEWSACSVTCGGGIAQRTRTILSPNRSTCKNIQTVEQVDCNTQSCGTTTPRNATTPAPCSGGKIMQFCHNVTCPYTCAHRQHLTQCQESHTCVDGCFCPPGQLEDSTGTCVVPEKCECDLKQVDCGKCEYAICVDGLAVCAIQDKCDCEWGDWTPWTQCSRSCGGGVHTRTREPLNVPANGGKPCPGPNQQEQPCNSEACPTCVDNTTGLNYPVGSVMPSNSQCVTCYCDEKLNKTCAPLADNEKPAPTWSAWNAWTSCSVSCGTGVKTRVRACQDICQSGSPCPGENTMQDECVKEQCNKEDCQLNDDWSTVIPCNATCSGNADMAYGWSQLKASVKVPEHYGGECKDTKWVPCSKPCDVDCVVISWTPFSPCTSTCNENDATCNPACGVGVRTSYPSEFIEAKNNGTKCTKRTEPCQLGSCNCTTPMQNNVTKNLCRMKCSDLMKENVCHVQSGEVFVGCACPDPYVEQNGDCVLPKDCNCAWDVNKLGPKPTDSPNELPPDSVVSVECNNCTCADGVWNCGQKVCKQDCVLSDWIQWGSCNASCGEGVQKYKREILQPALYGGRPCDNVLEKEETCRSQSQPCCDPNMELSTQCPLTCLTMMHQENHDHNCQPTCSCKYPLVLDEKTNQCVPFKNCSDTECVVNGITYPSSYSAPNYETCTYDVCLLGKFSSQPMDVKDLPPCSLADQIRKESGSPVIKHATNCCYYTVEPPCSLVPSNLTTLEVANGEICELVDPLLESYCSGSCPGSSKYSNVAYSSTAAANAALASSMQANEHKCSCCVPVEDGVNDPIFQGIINVQCKDGRSVAYPSYKIKACTCSSSPSGSCPTKK